MSQTATYRRGRGQTVRVVVFMDQAELAEIDAWGVPAGMASRSEAIRRLIRDGLKSTPSVVPVDKRENSSASMEITRSAS